MYSDNVQEVYNSFYALVNYFESGYATIAERQFLATENNNFIARLISGLRRDYPEESELLSSTVGEVFRATAQENLNNYDFEGYSDDSDEEFYDGRVEIIGNCAAAAA